MLRMVPLPRSVSLRGGGKTTPFSRHIVPELCLRPRTNRSAPGNQRGKRSAERRIQPMPRSTSSCRHEPAPRARRAPQTSVHSLRNSSASGARSPSGAPHAALAGALASRLSSRPCFLDSRQRALPARLQAQCRDSTSRRGPSAAGRDARSRPGSGLRDRAQAPHLSRLINDLCGCARRLGHTLGHEQFDRSDDAQWRACEIAIRHLREQYVDSQSPLASARDSCADQSCNPAASGLRPILGGIRRRTSPSAKLAEKTAYPSDRRN